MNAHTLRPSSCACIVLLLWACNDAPRPVTGQAGPVSPPPSVAEPGPEDPAGLEPPGPIGAPLRFTLQEGWIEEQPSSSVRRAQYRLPKVEQDPEDAQLVIYYFGEQAGTVEANVERWTGQFTQPDGSDSRAHLRRRTLSLNGRGVEEVELRGTYVAETTPGSGQRLDKPGFAMLAAIVSSDHGPYYLKLVGPQATVEHWRKSFTGFVSSIR